jgi:hypothetical protein
MIDVKYYVKGRTGSRSGTYYASTHLADVSKEIQAFLKETAPGARNAAAQAAATYLVGDGRHGLKHYPAYKWIRRRQAYGKPFFSAKQRRFVMASLRAGKNLKTGTPMEPGFPHRTGNLQRGWQTRGAAGGVMIYNTMPHVLPVMGDDVQSRHERLVGWRMVSDILETNLDGALLAAQRAAIKYYKEQEKR